MNTNSLVFNDSITPIDKLIEHLIKNCPALAVRDVHVVDAARAAEGEVWSPQLFAHEAWVASKEKASGADGDLLRVGALGMGLSDDERTRVLAQATHRSTQERQPEALREQEGSEGGLRGAIEVRQDTDGYAIVGVDLHRFAQTCGGTEDLIVALPASIGGVPVVRIAAEAFSRRRVQGVGVRLLVVPDTVKRIGAHAFLALSAQCIHLGCNVEVLGEQPCDLAGVSPRLARRSYSVDKHNKHFSAYRGSLFSSDGTRLLFLAAPSTARVELPRNVEHIEAGAFATGCELPAVVVCPQTLARVDTKAWDDAVWLCPHGAPACHALRRRGVRLAGPRAFEQDGCWYDFDEDGAVLVAGPPKPASVSRRFAEQAAAFAAAVHSIAGDAAGVDGELSPSAVAAQAATEFAASGEAGSTVGYVSASASEVLALPREVAGRPLVCIGIRALPFAPASVVIPDTVRVIERDNACRGTKRLVLAEGLERIGEHCFWSRKLEGPVLIPASVHSIGKGCFEYAVCRLEHTKTIIHVSADQLLSCFLADPPDEIPFDFARYDELLRTGKNLPDRLGAVLHRLAMPFRLADDTRDVLVSYLRDHERETQERVARDGDRVMVEALVHVGFIDERTFDRQIELLRACNRTDCVLYLMEWHREQGGQSKPSSSRDRFAL